MSDEEVDEPRREMIVIDAQTGATIERWNNLQTSGTTDTDYGFYAGQVNSFPIDLTPGTYLDTYAKFVNTWMNAARNRFRAGSAQALQTFNAWQACGIAPSVTP